MKRTLSCVAAVLVCTALVAAEQPSPLKQPSQTELLPTKISNPAWQSQQATEPTIGQAQPVLEGQDWHQLLTNRAPDGYVGPKEVHTAGLRVDCPGSVPEGEPVCSDGYDDTFNTGCNADAPPYPFSPIQCGQKILGTSGTFLFDGNEYRDTDWYQITVTEGTEFTFSVVADFDVLIFLIQPGPEGSECDDLKILRSATAPMGQTATITKCCAAGTYWFWVGPQEFSGVTCGAQYCAELTCVPCTPPPPPACPSATTLVGQVAYGEDDPWTIYVSNDMFPDFNPANGIKRLEHYIGVGGQIEDLHWWGCSAVYNDFGFLVQCPLDPGTFQIEFWAHNDVTNRPDYALGPVYSFTASSANGLTKTDTGHVYIGSDDNYQLWYWSVNLPLPYTAFEGWISIKNMDHCWFWWAGSPEGGTIHVMWDEATGEKTDEEGDLSYCLTASNIGPFTGACCDRSNGTCRNTDATDCVGTYDEFYPNLQCNQITCTFVTWACCVGTACITVDANTCNQSGTWYPGYVCNTSDPRYLQGYPLKDCREEEVCGITCPTTPTPCVGRNLAGGWLFISWDRGAGDQRFVIDDFTPCSGSLTRFHIWGNSCTVWDGPDCSFAQPAPFVVRVYPNMTGSQGDQPDVNAPFCTQNVSAKWSLTNYIWSGRPEWGRIECYTAPFAPACAISGTRKWIGIASATPDPCDFIWAPGANDNNRQWFYDNGNLILYTDASGGMDRSLCLYTGVITGACCREDTGVCTNGVQEGTCLAQGGRFAPGQTCAQIYPPCQAVPGACCDRRYEQNNCEVTLLSQCTAPREWLGVRTTCDDCCVVICPSAGYTNEGEPICSDGYVDTYNYGCFTEPTWSFPDDWLQIVDNQSYCGTMGTYTTGGQNLRDLDWYYYELTSPVALIRAHVKGEFQPDVYLLNFSCDPLEVLSEGAADPCGDAVASGALLQGTYFVVVSCFGTVTCGEPYKFWIEKGTAGACEIGPTCIETSQNVCIALGGQWTANQPCGGPPPCQNLRGDCNCNGTVNAFDIDAFVLALTNPAQWQQQYTCDILCVADCNCDGQINAFDIDMFVQCLTQGGCQPCP